MGLVFSMFKTLFKVFLSLFKSFDWLFYIILIFLVALIIDFIFVKIKYFRGCKREKIAHINFDGKVSIFEQIFIQLPRQFWTNFYNKKVGEFNEHGIIMFTGKQGQGKTLAETKYLMDMQYKYPSVKVATNYGYLKEDEQIDDWHKLVDYNNGKFGVICAIDECQNWFSSSMSKNFPPRMLATVTQNRKNKRVIIMSSHFFTNVSKPIRQHCTEIRACRTFLKCFTVVTRYEPIMNGDGDVIKLRRLGMYSFVHSQELYNSYDTYKVISNLSVAGFKDDDFAVIVGGNDNTPKSVKKGFSRRSALAESTVNNNIDNAFRLMR